MSKLFSILVKHHLCSSELKTVERVFGIHWSRSIFVNRDLLMGEKVQSSNISCRIFSHRETSSHTGFATNTTTTNFNTHFIISIRFHYPIISLLTMCRFMPNNIFIGWKSFVNHFFEWCWNIWFGCWIHLIILRDLG